MKKGRCVCRQELESDIRRLKVPMRGCIVEEKKNLSSLAAVNSLHPVCEYNIGYQGHPICYILNAKAIKLNLPKSTLDPVTLHVNITVTHSFNNLVPLADCPLTDNVLSGKDLLYNWVSSQLKLSCEQFPLTFSGIRFLKSDRVWLSTTAFSPDNFNSKTIPSQSNLPSAEPAVRCLHISKIQFLGLFLDQGSWNRNILPPCIDKPLPHKVIEAAVFTCIVAVVDLQGARGPVPSQLAGK